jgi:hypothetical protein
MNSGGWNLSEADAAALRERLAPLVEPLKIAAIEAIRHSLSGVSVVVDPPLLPSYTLGLPQLVIDRVIEEITGSATDTLFDEVLAGAPGDYGRCGGMAFAAVDYFLASRDVPMDATQPLEGPLHDFIWQRLLDSLDLNLDRFLDWTVQLHVLPPLSSLASAAIGTAAGAVGGPVGAAIGALVAGGADILGVGGADVLAARTRDELAELRRNLDASPAWPIGLVYGDTALIWEQHQIVAQRYRELPDGRLELRIWDNNRALPSEDDGEPWIVDARGDQLTVEGAGRDIKGILCDRYQPAGPPR